MNILDNITKNFVRQSREIIGDNLVGIYLHGSAAMGCFNEKKSDIDLIAAVNASLPKEIKRRYMDMVVELNEYAPKKGIELSIVRKDVCKPFVYPTPYELHFSVAHLRWYKTNPTDYVERMNGLDKDLAAHFTVIYHRGKCLYGKEIKSVFEKADKEFYFDSIWNDVENSVVDIQTDPTYIILNLCRVLAYKKDGLILSKLEGGEWGANNISEKYRGLIARALDDYTSDRIMEWDKGGLREYAEYMTDRIKAP